MTRPAPITCLIRFFLAAVIFNFSPVTAFSGDRTDHPDSIRVMTFNIRYDTQDDGIIAWPDRRLIDYIFISNGFVVRRHRTVDTGSRDPYPSDHLPVPTGLCRNSPRSGW